MKSPHRWVAEREGWAGGGGGSHDRTLPRLINTSRGPQEEGREVFYRRN